MDGLRMGQRLLNGRLGDSLLSAANRLLYLDAVRKPAFRVLDRWLCTRQVRAQTVNTISSQRALIYRAVLHTVDRLLSRQTLSSFPSAKLTASNSAPKIRGRACAKSAQRAFSVLRRSSGIVGNVSWIARSRRSDRVARSSMPFSMTGRRASKSVSSSFSYSVRVANPPPVDRRHSELLSQG